MNKFSRMLIGSFFIITSLFANSDENVIEFEKKRLAQNPNVKVEKVTINTKKALPISGWNGYILDVTAKLQDKEVNAKDILFANEKYISLDFIDAKTGKSLKDFVTPDLSPKYYNKSKIIAGNPNAKNKLVIFSDPLCPFCISYVPEVIEHVNKNKDSLALYYYHFPLLRLHPAAGILTKAMDIAKEKGVKNVENKTYTIKWGRYFDSKSVDEEKILSAFNKEFNTDITLKEIKSKKIEDTIRKDLEMGEAVMVQGTPTIFVNGIKDSSKVKYQTLGHQ